jgi:hypothetical protein
LLFLSDLFGLSQNSSFAVLFVMLLFVILYGYIILPHSVAQSSHCDPTTLNSQMNQDSSALNQTRAISLANQSLANSICGTGTNNSFNGIFFTWSWDSNCLVTWLTVNVVYGSTNKNNGTSQYVVVTENPTATQVEAIYGEGPTASLAPSTSYNQWSGYEFKVSPGSGGAYSVYSEWELTQAEVPPSPPAPQYCNNGDNDECRLAIWDGESNQAGGNNGFAQGGSDSQLIYLGRGGWAQYYYLAYEFIPGSWFGAVDCMQINYNHLVAAEMTASSGTDSIYVYDWNLKSGCGTQSHSENTPNWGQFIAEIPTWVSCWGLCKGVYVLAEFPAFGFNYASVNGQDISSIGTYNTYVMSNGGYLDIQLGPISCCSHGSYFTETWKSSGGT